MVLTEKRMYNYYLEDDEITITRIRDKYKKKDKKRIKGSSKIKCILLIALIFIIGTTLLYQHTKINTINNDIISLEKDLKDLKMINDSKEGTLLSSYDLDSIEKIAKENLGMVEPTTDQYTYLVVDNNQQLAKNDGEEKADKTNNENTVSWLARLID